MIRNTLIQITSQYLRARTESFTGHPLANFMRNEAPLQILNTISSRSVDLIGLGSAGKGQWTDVPWLAFLNPLVTLSPQREYYVDYLFSSDMKRIYLCLGQGVTDLKSEFGKSWQSVLHQRSEILRARVPEFTKSFPKYGGKNLGNAAHLGQSYSDASAFYQEYDANNLPTEEVLIAHLKQMLYLYELIFTRGGTNFTDNSDVTEFPNTSLEERKKIRIHKSFEGRVNTLQIKKLRGYNCEACNFDFIKVYGELGKNFIEVHHLIPFSELEVGKFRILNVHTDFAMLCANCHRMIHRTSEPHNLMNFKKLIS